MTASDLIRTMKDLPPASPAALKLSGLLNRPTQHNDDIVEALRCDSVLTAKLLRVCNSSYFALREPAGSVAQAVLLLGHQEIVRIVLTLGFGGSLNRPLPGYAVADKEMWRHALTTALAAERVSECAGSFEPAVAFTAGLLHDIGKLVLNQVLTPDVQAAVRARIEQGTEARDEAEKSVLNTDHAEVGACLLEEWRLPELVVEAVAHHHRPVVTPRPRLSAVVHVANGVAHLVGSAPGWDSYAVRVEEQAVSVLGLDGGQIEQLVISMHGCLQQVDQSLALS